ncbi:MAG: hypothetical protein ACYDGO_11045 [Smithellaceae bacterium]
MNQQQMTKEMIEYDNSLPDNASSAINTIWDQSAKIFAAVIDNANLLPDDGGNEIGKGVSVYSKKHRGPGGFNKKARIPLTKFALTCLQEEHALWLK